MSKFKTEQSSTPAAGPKGALNRANLATQALLDGEAEALTRKVVELAKEGNLTALRLCLERLLPPRKDRPSIFALPQLEGAEDLPQALKAILEAVAQGERTPEEGQILTAMLEVYRKGLETMDLEVRITELEKEKARGRS